MLIDNIMTFSGGDILPVNLVGRYLRIRDSASPIYISINGGQELKREKGEQIDLGVQFDTLRVTVRSLVAQTVYLTSAANKQDDSRANINATISTTVVSGNDNQHLPKINIAPGSAVKIAASNTSRSSLRISLLSDAPGYLLLGKSGVTASSGGSLEPGMVDYVETQGELWAYNPQASSVDVFVMEVNKI